MRRQRTLQGDKSNLALKRNLRREMTRSEKRLWRKIRGKQLRAVGFRRQHGIGPYVVDFFCPEKKIAIEIDGDVHAFDKQKQRDQIREDFLRGLGIRVVRYTNNDILKNVDGVMEDLYRRIT